jgi:hypothetical protein
MKEIRNKTSRPLRVSLPGGKTLHLGPAQVAQIADKAADHPGMQKLIKDGSIEILGDGERVIGTKGPGGVHEETHGSTKSFRRGQGDR